MPIEASSGNSADRIAQARHRAAWLALTAVLALHVCDEAATGFLGFYNPLVLQLRARFGWFPAPTFRFSIWLIGLALLVLLLWGLAPLIARGGTAASILSWALGAIMFMNGAAHLGGSAYWGRWLPGSTTAPLLLIASVWLLYTTRRRAVLREGTRASMPPGHGPSLQG